MVNDILTAAGVPFRRGRFIPPAPATYAVYTDDLTTDGPDRGGLTVPGMPVIVTHRVDVELYESRPDDAAEVAIEAAILAAGLQFDKQDRTWLQSEQQYQVVYTFEYTEKRRI